ncbi:MAG: hypothetical protein HFH15_07010 [Ruminococcus sp.]|nr:hypothetical protein [Ruminococcus sp.]
MKNKTHRTEFIGDLRAEFQEIDKAYEHEKAAEEIFSFTVDCCEIYTILCC